MKVRGTKLETIKHANNFKWKSDMEACFFQQELKKNIEQRVAWLEAILSQCKIDGSLDDESLDVYVRNGALECSIIKKKVEEGRIYYSKQFGNKAMSQHITALGQRDYNKMILVRTERELRMWKSCLRRWKSVEEIYGKMSKGRKALVNPVYIPEDEFVSAWESVQYEGLGFADDDSSDYYTDKNERVRSKSELLIANMLNKYDVPYRYEYPMVLGYKVRYPDFYVLNKRTREEFVWEHLGMMDDSAYLIKNMNKLNEYLKAGFVMGDKLLLTMESKTAPLSMSGVKSLIEKKLI